MYHYHFNGHGYKFAKIIHRVFGEDYRRVNEESGVAIVSPRGDRVLKLVDDPACFHVIFDVPVPNLSEHVYLLKHIDEETEKPHQHFVYKGDRLEDLLVLAELAKKNDQERRSPSSQKQSTTDQGGSS